MKRDQKIMIVWPSKINKKLYHQFLRELKERLKDVRKYVDAGTSEVIPTA